MPKEDDLNLPEKLEWTVHPVRKNLRNSVLLVLFLLFLLTLIYIAFENIVFVFLSAVLLLGSLLKFFTPTRYILTASEITIIGFFGKTFKNWTAFKSFWPDKNGVLLSPFPEKSRLENFRGVYLLWGDTPNTKGFGVGANRETVLKFIETKIKR